jgi:hypothetical protein
LGSCAAGNRSRRGDVYSVLSDAAWRALFKRANFAVLGYTTYTVPRRWPNGFLAAGFVEADDPPRPRDPLTCLPGATPRTP